MKILQKTKNNSRIIGLFISVLFVFSGVLIFSASVAAAPLAGCSGGSDGSPSSGKICPTTFAATSSQVTITNPKDQPTYYCGNGDDKVYVSIDIGCSHNINNPIIDMIFAIIRLLSDGVGIVVIASVIVGGIQYSTSHGDPQATAAATARIRASMMALFIYIFAYAILNYVIPIRFFQ
ncbi:MAG TPA: hypothetical protein VMR08_00735 [Patescibacteria group bacterium]|jgi:hypothetical protein|nr:hypothetical protein [Patescibacteria group bacterium]